MGTRRTPEQVAASRAAAAESKLKQRVAEARLESLNRVLERAGQSWGGADHRRHGPMGAAGSYTNARTRLRAGTVPRGGSADWHADAITRRDLRRDSQQALRVDPLAKAMFKGLMRLTVGDGPSIEPQTGDKVFNARKKALFNAWANNDYEEAVRLGYTGTREAWTCDARGLNTLLENVEEAMKAAVTDGDLGIGITHTDDKGGGGKLIFFEAERMMGPKGLYALPDWIQGQGGWVDGVELNGDGLAIRVGVAPWNNVQNFAGPGGAKNLEFLNLRDGTGLLFRNPMDHSQNQTRGEPALAALLPRLDQLDAYEQSVVETMRIQACFTGVITGPNPGMYQNGLPSLDVTEPSGASTTASTQRQAKIEPGTLFDAGMGTEVKFPTPGQPGAQYRDFSQQQWNVVGGDLGSSAMVATMDATQSNYSGFRAALALNFRITDRWRKALDRLLRFIEVFKTAQWIDAGLLEFPRERGENEGTDVDGVAATDDDDAMLDTEETKAAKHDIAVKPEDWRKPSHFIWPPMPSLDPSKEVQGLSDAMNVGLISRPEAISVYTGRNMADVDRERGEAQQSERVHGIMREPVVVGGGYGVARDPAGQLDENGNPIKTPGGKPSGDEGDEPPRPNKTKPSGRGGPNMGR